MHMFVLLRLLVFNKQSHVLCAHIVLSELSIPRGATNYRQLVSSLKCFLLNSFLLNVLMTIPVKWEAKVAHSGDSIHVNCLHLFSNGYNKTCWYSLYIQRILENTKRLDSQRDYCQIVLKTCHQRVDSQRGY